MKAGWKIYTYWNEHVGDQLKWGLSSASSGREREKVEVKVEFANSVVLAEEYISARRKYRMVPGPIPR